MEGGGGGGLDCKWALGGMAAFVVMLIAWIKSLLKDLSDEKEKRYADMKDHLEKVQD